MMVTPGRFFLRTYEKKIIGTEETRQVSDYVHLKAIAGKGKFLGTVVGSHKKEKAYIDVKTLEGAIEISKFDFENVLKELTVNA